MSTSTSGPKTVTEFLAALPDAQRSDARRLHKLIRKAAPALKPVAGFGGVAYGPLRVRYPTGREVNWMVVGLAGRKNGFALHVMLPADGSPMPEIKKDRFPRGDVGKSCVRFRKLADLDETAIVALVRAALRAQKTWASRTL